MNSIIRVLIVDDSAYVRKVIKQMLSRSPFIEVVGTAHDGQEALEMVEQLQPDVITLDLMMPVMNGVEFLNIQMKRRPIPVVVVSIASESGEMALDALNAGAVDFVQKPTALATETVFNMSDELLQKVKAVASVQLPHLAPPAPTPSVLPVYPKGLGRMDILVLGISTGGPQALTYLIPQLPAHLPMPVAIVLHMPVGYTEMYAHRLNQISSVKVIEAHQGDVLEAGVVLIAPAGRHLSFIRRLDGQVVTHLDVNPIDTLHRPSVDVLFQSAAEVFGNRVLGVIMTGMGSDGKQGAAWIKSKGGMMLTEAEESCVVYGMPRSVVEAGLSDQSVPLTQMANAILELI